MTKERMYTVVPEALHPSLAGHNAFPRPGERRRLVLHFPVGTASKDWQPIRCGGAIYQPLPKQEVPQAVVCPDCWNGRNSYSGDHDDPGF